MNINNNEFNKKIEAYFENTDPETIGVWTVMGASDDEGFGYRTGKPYQPTIGTFSGKFRDVVEYAVCQPNFWGYGGGDFIKLDVIQVDEKIVEEDENVINYVNGLNNKARKEIKIKLDNINKEKEELENQLSSL